MKQSKIRKFKIGALFLIIGLFFVLLTGCVDSPITVNETDIDLAYEQTQIKFAAGDTRTSVSKEFQLPTSVAGVSIEWISSNEDVISIVGGQTVINRLSEDVVVYITAKIGHKGVYKYKTFEVTVLADDTVPPEEVRHQVRFFADGIQYGEVQFVLNGNRPLIPKNPYKEGHRFMGWFLDSNFAIPLDNTYKVTRNIDLYGKFEQGGFLVKFFVNGRLYDTQDVKYGDSAIAPPEPNEPGYYFLGWNRNSLIVIDNLDIHAILSPIPTYTVVFMDHDNTVLKRQVGVEHLTQATAPDDPTRIGYTFDGWDKEFDSVTSDLTVKATYTAIPYTVTFKVPDMDDVVQTYIYEQPITLPSIQAKEGHDFGWDDTVPETMPAQNIVINGSYKVKTYSVYYKVGGVQVAKEDYKFGVPITIKPGTPKQGYTFAWNPDSLPATMPANDITVNGTYTPISYTITYNLDGGNNHENNPATYNIETPTITLKPATKTGFNFLGWYVGDTKVTEIVKGSTGEKTLTARFESDTETFTVTLSDGLSSNDPYVGVVAGSKVLINVTVPGGKRIVKFTVDGRIVQLSENLTHLLTVEKNHNVAVEFAENPPLGTPGVLKYGLDTTSNMGDGNQARALGQSEELFIITAVKGDQNNNIGLNRDGTTRLYTNKTGNGNKLVVQSLNDKKIIKLEIVLGNGKDIIEANNPSAQIILGTEEIAITDLTKLQDTTLTYDNLNIDSFSIQNTQLEGAGNSQIWIKEIIVTFDGGTPELETFEVTFDLQDGSLDDVELVQEVVKGNLATNPGKPTKDGCVFIGWRLENSETNYDFSQPVTKSFTLYAHYEVGEEKYTVTLGAGLDAGEAELKNLEAGTKILITVIVPDNKEVDTFTVDGESAQLTENLTYLLEVSKDHELEVTFKTVYPLGTPGVLQYTVAETTNMGEGNQAGKLGQSEDLFNITAIQGDTNYNVGLNQTGSIRLYCGKDTGNGNKLVVEILDDKKITNLEIELLAGRDLVDDNNPSAKIVLGNEIIDVIGAANLKSTTLTYSNLNITSFSIQNTQLGGSKYTQIWISKITVTYEDDVPVEKVTVTFDLNEGTLQGLVSPQEIEKGTKVANPGNPTKDGHRFVEWRLQNQELPYDFNSEVNNDITLVAHYELIEMVTVTFNLNEGELEGFDLEQEIEKGTKVAKPENDPIKAGHRFVEWRLQNQELPYDFNSEVYKDIILVAHYEADARTAINSAQQLLDLFGAGGAGEYYLANDIDMTDVEYAGSSKTFTGVLDGNNKSIKNLNVTTSGDKMGGMFKILQGATIKDLTIENSSINGFKEATGMIAAHIQAGTTVENVKFVNVKTSSSGSYAGLIAGDNANSSTGTIVIKNIIVDNDANHEVSARRYAGGLVGYLRVADTVNISNVYIKSNVKVVGNSTAGALVGRTHKDGVVLNVDGVYVEGTISATNYVGGLVGEGSIATSITINNVVLSNVTINGGSDVDLLVARRGTFAFTITNVVYENTQVLSNDTGIEIPAAEATETELTEVWFNGSALDKTFFGYDNKVIPLGYELQPDPEPETYTVTLTGEGLSSTPEVLTDLAEGTKVTIQVTVPAHKTIATFKVDGEDAVLSDNNTYEITVSKNHEVAVTYNDILYKVTLLNDELSSENTLVDLLAGTKVTIKVTIPDGQEVDKFYVDELETALTTATTYELTVSGNHNVSVTFKDKEAEKFTVTLSSEGLSSTPEVLKDLVAGSEVTIQVTVPAGKRIVKFTVDNKPFELSDNLTYLLTVEKNHNVKVEFADNPPLGTPGVLQYTVEVTSNMGNGNQARALEQSEDLFNITAIKGDPFNNIGLNRDGTIRLYTNKTANGNTLSVQNLSDKKIIGVEIILGTGKDIVEANNPSMKIVLGDQEIVITDLEQLKAFTHNYTDLSIDSFSIQNTQNEGGGNSQIWISKINVTFEGGTPELETVNVTFDLQEGTLEGLELVQEVTVGNAVANPGEPTKDGFTFIGWRLEGSSTNYDFSLPVTEAIKLVAHYEEGEEKYTVTLGDNLQADPPLIGLSAGAKVLVSVVNIPDGQIVYKFTVDGVVKELSENNTYLLVVSDNHTLAVTFRNTPPEGLLLQSDFGETDGWGTYGLQADATIENGLLDHNPDGTTKWDVMGGNVNRSGWNYIRMGGKAAAVLDPATVYLKTNFTFNEVVTEIVINIVALDPAEGDEIIYLQSSTDGETWVNVANKVTVVGDLVFNELNIAAGSYIRFVFERGDTGNNNRGTDVKTITFYTGDTTPPEPETYTVTLTGEGLSSTPEVLTNLVEGAKVTIQVTVPAHKTIATFKVDNVDAELGEDNTYLLTVSGDHIVTVTYNDVLYKVTVTGDGYTTVPEALTGLAADSQVVFTFSKAGYNLTGLTLDNNSVFDQVSDNKYTLTVTQNHEVVVTFTPIVYQVTFMNGDIEHHVADVNHGETVGVPDEPTQDGYDFKGWRLENATENFDFNTLIEESFTLFAYYEVATAPEGNAINTAEELVTLFTNGGDGNYYLAQDIDMTDVVYTGTQTSKSIFSGTFDGNGKTIKNFNVTTANNKSGAMFGILSDATIKNLTIENSSVEGPGEGAGFISAYAYEGTTFDNIKLINVSVSTTGSYSGLLFADNLNGSGTRPLNISNVIVINDDTHEIKAGKYAGGLIGDLRYGQTINISNIYMKATVKTTSETASAIIGRIQNADVIVNMDNIYFEGELGASKHIGVLVADSNYAATFVVSNVVISDTTIIGGNDTDLLIGRRKTINLTTADVVYQNVSITGTPSAAADPTEATETVLNQEWFDVSGLDKEFFGYENNKVIPLGYELPAEPAKYTVKLLNEALSAGEATLTNVEAGTKITITVTIPEDYEIDKFYVDGLETQLDTETTYELTVSGNHNVSVTFKALPVFTVEVTGDGVTSVPADLTNIVKNKQVEFTFEKDGYILESVTVDNNPVQPVGNKYTLTVTDNHAVVVTWLPTIATVRVQTSGEVTFVGVVTNISTYSNKVNIAVADSTGAINVYDATDVTADTFVVGDKVKVVGTRGEHQGLQRIVAGSTMTKLSSGNELPEATTIDSLLNINDVQTRFVNISNLEPVSYNNRNLTVKLGEQTIIVRSGQSSGPVLEAVEGAVSEKYVNLTNVFVDWYNGSAQFLVANINQIEVVNYEDEERIAVIKSILDYDGKEYYNKSEVPFVTAHPRVGGFIEWEYDPAAAVADGKWVAINNVETAVKATAKITAGNAYDDTYVANITVNPQYIEAVVLGQSDFGITDGWGNYALRENQEINNGALDPIPAGTTLWDVMGGNVNNTGWDYIRMGGKAAAVLEPATVYLKTNYTFDEIIHRIVVNIVALDSAPGDEIIYLQSSTDGTNWNNIANKVTIIGNLEFDELNIPSGSYIRFVFERASTGNNNRGTDIKTITFENISLITPDPVTVDVTFDLDDGVLQELVSPKAIVIGDTVDNPGNPTKEGYTFEEWRLQGKDTAYVFSTPVIEPITLVAHYTINQ